MLADITGADRAQHRVGDRVSEDIVIVLSLEAARMRDRDSAENQSSIFGEPMRVVSDSAPDRAHSFKSITPLEATMLYLSFMSWRGRRSTVPPAVSTKIHPPAMSPRLIPCSM